jgi:hypothetical protein
MEQARKDFPKTTDFLSVRNLETIFPLPVSMPAEEETHPNDEDVYPGEGAAVLRAGLFHPHHRHPGRCRRSRCSPS